ncbi:MAG: YjbE family putative metal transport protein, partial [Syntrophales bacterium]|nr:YjbE family putative metal transport protein [Syntrophales bacterium]
MIDLGILGQIHFTADFLVGFVSIIIIDLILAGDNAVVIAMAVQSLEKAQRIKGIIFGAGAAVVLRVILTFFVAQLLTIAFVKLVGGILILWIGFKLFVEGAPGNEDECREAKSLAQAIWIIIVADVTMSLDNILAVAGAKDATGFVPAAVL